MTNKFFLLLNSISNDIQSIRRLLSFIRNPASFKYSSLNF
ncbi:hypothetical protein BGAFAR04_C0013 (plasmid) [Borreliella garinii Far04]|nr:hypothetical protein BGAFAR04_C0013 [Borreliella garinii Far04]